MRVGKCLASFASALLVVGSVGFAKPISTPSINAVNGGNPSINAASYFAGFEAAEGFALGTIDGQVGWSSSGVNLPAFAVDNTNPFAGTNQLRIINDTTVAAGTQRLVFSPNLGAQPVNAQETSIQVDISNDQGADYDVAGQAPSQGFITWRVKFHFDDGAGGLGTIFILDDVGSGLAFQSTLTPWVPGAYQELKVVTDPNTNQMDYYYGGNLIYQSAAGLFAGTIVEQVVLITDNFQLANETADFDNLNIVDVPEPASMGLLVLGAAFAGGRRRR